MLPVYGHDRWSGNRSTSGTYRWTTSPARAGIGEPLHRWTTSPARGGTGERVHRYRLVGSANDKHPRSHRKKSVGLYHPTERTHIQLNMSWKRQGRRWRTPRSRRPFWLCQEIFKRIWRHLHVQLSRAQQGAVVTDLWATTRTATNRSLTPTASRVSGVFSILSRAQQVSFSPSSCWGHTETL